MNEAGVGSAPGGSLRRVPLTREPRRSSETAYVRQVVWRLCQQPGVWRLLIGASLLEALFALVSPWLASRALDTALPNSAHALLGLLGGLIIAAAVHSAWAGWTHKRVSNILQHRVEASALNDVLCRYLATPYDKLQKTQFGSTNEALSSASLVVIALVQSGVECVTHLAAGATTLLLLAAYDLGLALSTLGLAFTLALASMALSVREARVVERVLESSSQSHQLLHVLLRAVHTLRAFGATRRLADRWTAAVQGQTVETIRRENARLSRLVLIQAGQHAGSWGATVWLIHRVLDSSLSLGVLMTASMLVGNFLRVALGLTQTGVSFLTMRPHLARVDALLADSTAANAVPRVSYAELAPLESEGIRVQDLWYSYDNGGRWVLQGHCQHFPAGQLSVLRAPSGAGKSTLLRLIRGLLSPERGSVSVFGLDPRHVEGLVAYLPQQSSLLEASIATNLTALSGASLEHALEIAALTGLSDMLSSLPMGAETLISSSGGNLSAGQRQLVALTAVFSTREPVVLLDEVVSQLDCAAQARIQWSALARGRTIISVQHV